MQTMKLTLEFPYNPKVVSALLGAAGAAVNMQAGREALPAETETEPEAAAGEPETAPAAKPETKPAPEAQPATVAEKAAPKTPKKPAKTTKTVAADIPAATLEDAAKTQETPEKTQETPEKTQGTPAKPAGVSMNDIRKEAVRLAQGGKQQEIRAILEGLGAECVSKIPVEKYDEALAAMQAVETEVQA